MGDWYRGFVTISAKFVKKIVRYTKRPLRPYMNQDNQAVLCYKMLKIGISTQNILEICYRILRTSVKRFIGFMEKSVYIHINRVY